MNLITQTKKLIFLEKDSRVQDAISDDNLATVHSMSFFIILFEVIALIIVIASSLPEGPSLRPVLQVGFCIVSCILIALLTKYLQFRKQKGFRLSRLGANILIIVFYSVMTLWGLFVDTAHYAKGEQMMTFYIVQFCFAAFLVYEPLVATIIYLGGFAVFYYALQQIDGAATIQPVNLLVFLFVILASCYVHYVLKYNEKKNRLNLVEENDDLLDIVRIDDLTQLKNRYSLRMEFEKYLGKPLYVTMLDIDYFKHFNDTYGHQMGDEVIRAVAQTLREYFGRGSVYRYGGDEFLVVFTDYDETDYETTMRFWRNAVAKLRVDGVTEPIRCSYGFVTGTPHTTEDYRALIRKADQELYAIKRVHHGEH